MAGLIEILESFNRKERYFLITQALGIPKFELSEPFRQSLGKKIGLEERNIEVPRDAFVAMDYHLNWLHASLVIAHHDCDRHRVELLREKGTFEKNQEDVDLLVAFPEYTGGSKTYHIICIEAKGFDANGLASFDVKQLKSKGQRLSRILKPSDEPYPDVESHFCLMSGSEPKELPTEDWKYWLPLCLPPERRLVKYGPSTTCCPSIWEPTRERNSTLLKMRMIVPSKKPTG